jgi:hypothetical protein
VTAPNIGAKQKKKRPPEGGLEIFQIKQTRDRLADSHFTRSAPASIGKRRRIAAS